MSEAGKYLSRRYINVCNRDMFSVINVYLDHLKFCVVGIDGRRYVCCSECNVVSNECNEPPSCLVQTIGTHGGEVKYFGCVCFRGELGHLFNCTTHPTALTPENLWDRHVKTIRELSFRDPENLD